RAPDQTVFHFFDRVGRGQRQNRRADFARPCDDGRNPLRRDEGAHGVVDGDDFGPEILRRFERVQDRIAALRSSANQKDGRADAMSRKGSLETPDLFPAKRNDDSADLATLVKPSQRVNDDRSSRDLEKLFWDFSAKPAAAAGGWNNSNIHNGGRR